MTDNEKKYKAAFMHFYDDAQKTYCDLLSSGYVTDDVAGCRLCPFLPCEYVRNAGKYLRMSDDEQPKFNCREEIYKFYLENSK